MNQAEHYEQVALFDWARQAEGRFPELGLLFAVPNGGARNVVTGTRLKKEGVKRGVPDVWLPVARGGYHGLVIEMKTAKGRASPEQKIWLRALAAEGWLAVICVGAEAAIKTVERYLSGDCDPASLQAGG